jgi:hypothetical protein
MADFAPPTVRTAELPIDALIPPHHDLLTFYFTKGPATSESACRLQSSLERYASLGGLSNIARGLG